MSAPPIPCVFRDGAFHPVGRFHNVAAAHYGEGEVVPLVPHEERSDATHKHQFAFLREAWQQLPEDLADQWATPEHFRKALLIQCGFYTEDRTDCGSNAAALRVAAVMRADDDYAHVVVRGPFVVRRRAKSQSHRAMGAADFQASKAAVLEAAAALIGVTPESLQRNAGRAA
jgi:hypothetical protein